jgi:hypothetical protein
MSDRIKHWLADTAERAFSTMAQAAIPAVLATGWDRDALYIALGAFGLCVLKCIAAIGVGAPDSASLLPADQDPPVEGDGGWGLIEVLAVVAVVLITLLLLGYLR